MLLLKISSLHHRKIFVYAKRKCWGVDGKSYFQSDSLYCYDGGCARLVARSHCYLCWSSSYKLSLKSRIWDDQARSVTTKVGRKIKISSQQKKINPCNKTPYYCLLLILEMLITVHHLKRTVYHQSRKIKHLYGKSFLLNTNRKGDFIKFIMSVDIYTDVGLRAMWAPFSCFDINNVLSHNRVWDVSCFCVIHKDSTYSNISNWMCLLTNKVVSLRVLYAYYVFVY